MVKLHGASTESNGELPQTLDVTARGKGAVAGDADKSHPGRHRARRQGLRERRRGRRRPSVPPLRPRLCSWMSRLTAQRRAGRVIVRDFRGLLGVSRPGLGGEKEAVPIRCHPWRDAQLGVAVARGGVDVVLTPNSSSVSSTASALALAHRAKCRCAENCARAHVARAAEGDAFDHGVAGLL